MENSMEGKTVPTEVDNSNDSNDSDKTSESTVKIHRTCLKHILIAMTICGCYNYSFHSNKNSIKAWINMVYQLTIFAVLLFFTGKTISAYAFIPKEEYFGQSIVLAWNVYSILNFLCGLKMYSNKFGNQLETFSRWDNKVYHRMANTGIEFKHRTFIKRQIILSITTLIIAVILVIFTSLQLTGTLGDGNSGLLPIPFQLNPSTIFLQTFLVLVCAMTAVIPMFYVIVVCNFMCNCFHGFNQFLRQQLCLENCKVPRDIQNLRQLHTMLCQMVKDFDKDFCYLFGNVVFWNLGLGLFVLYGLLRTDPNTYGIILVISYSFWLFLCAVFLGVMTVFAAFVCEAAHAPLDTIYYINVQDITVEKLAQLNLFLSKLTGTQVGFSTCGLLIITKEFILTIAGVFLTYFAVLYTL